MKKFSLLSFILLMTIAVILPSCNKDDDGDSSTSSFTLDGTTYTLSKGFIADFGDNLNGSYDFDIFLTSDGISRGGLGLTGMGDYVYIDLNTGLETGLEAGTYTFSTDREAFTFVDSDVYTNYDLTNFTGDVTDVTGGTVEIELNGSDVTITFNLEIAGGSTVTGTYEGSLEDL